MARLLNEKEKEDFEIGLLPQQSNSGVIIQDKHPVPQEEVVSLWGHAAGGTQRVRDYILLSVEGEVDKTNNQQAALIDEMVKNIRFEQSVIYKGNNGPSESFPSLVIRVDLIDKNREEYYALLYIPLDTAGPARTTHVQNHIDLDTIYVVPVGYKTAQGEYMKLAPPTNKLALYHGSISKGIRHMVHFNTPVWIYGDIDSLWNMETPYTNKLEIYLPDETEITGKLFSKIRDTYKDRCKDFEIVQYDNNSNLFKKYTFK